MTCPVCRRAPSDAAHHPACGPHCWQGLNDMSPRAAIGSCATVGALLFVASLVLLGGCADSPGACYVSTFADALDAAERIGCEVRP